MREWARLYQTPLWLTAAFIALLTLFALTPDPSRITSDTGPGPTSEPTRGPRECVVCGIDQQCDPSSGRCVFIKATPLPCVEGAKFDEKAGFCLPTGAPTAPPAPVIIDDDEEEEADPEVPRRPRDDREESENAFPFREERERDEDR